MNTVTMKQNRCRPSFKTFSGESLAFFQIRLLSNYTQDKTELIRQSCEMVRRFVFIIVLLVFIKILMSNVSSHSFDKAILYHYVYT